MVENNAVQPGEPVKASDQIGVIICSKLGRSTEHNIIVSNIQLLITINTTYRFTGRTIYTVIS